MYQTLTLCLNGPLTRHVCKSWRHLMIGLILLVERTQSYEIIKQRKATTLENLYYRIARVFMYNKHNT